MSDESIPEGTEEKARASCIRFTKEQYERLARESQMTGKTIPWLLKTAYFKGGITPPLLDAESRRIARRELGGIGNNLNQIARAAHAQGKIAVENQVREMIDMVRDLKQVLLRDYGDR